MENYKCGYCGWLLNNNCENYLDHRCFNFFEEGEHVLMANNNNVLTIEKKQHTSGSNVEKESSQQVEDSDELIICLVAERRPLYDFKLPLAQRTKAKKQDLWDEICNNLGGIMDADQIKVRWKYLRDSYVRAKRKVKEYRPSGSQGTPLVDHKFKYYDLMKFLDDPEETSNSSFSSVALPALSEDSLPLTSPSSGGTSETLPNIKSTPVGFRKKRKMEDEVNSRVLEVLAEPIVPPKPPSGLEGFLSRLGEALARLPYRRRAKLEIEFLQMAMAAEEG